MTIEEKDFQLIPIDESSGSFDLKLLHKIQPRGKEARLEFKNVAYGISLARAVNRIANFRVNQKHKDEENCLLIAAVELLCPLSIQVKSLY